MRTKTLAIICLLLCAAAGYGVLRYGTEIGSAWADVRQRMRGDEQAQAPAANAPTPSSPPGRTFPVEAARARAAIATKDLQSVGTLASDEAVSLAAETAGVVAEIRFKEGQPVAAGEVLVRLDDALPQADLANAGANLRLAESNFERATSLSRTGAGTERARDEARAALDTARAANELSRVRLDKTQIRAPFNGTAGLRSLSVGAYAQAGQTLVSVEKIDTLKLDFRLPEINLREIKLGQGVDISVDAFPDERFQGTVYAIDPLVDVNGRAVKVRARLPNTDGRLRPGLFARVTVHAGERGSVVMIPESALLPRGTDTIVFTVDNGKVAEAKVTIGERRAGEVEVLDGLQADATVVTAGQGRLRDGAKVDVLTDQKPS